MGSKSSENQEKIQAEKEAQEKLEAEEEAKKQKLERQEQEKISKYMSIFLVFLMNSFLKICES